jgi:ABC-type multidrug transport system ATPase subunit
MVLTGNQSLILLYEPFTTLDAETKTKLCELIHSLHSMKGINFLLSSHQEIEQDLLPITHYYTVSPKCIMWQEQV